MGHNVQNNNHDIDGRVVYLSNPVQISEKFTKRTLVIETFVGERRQETPFTFSNARMDCLKEIKVGDWLNVQYQLGGNKGKGEGEPRWFAENIGVNCIKG
jgi:hypothetical protein